jgi:hypothetical protein
MERRGDECLGGERREKMERQRRGYEGVLGVEGKMGEERGEGEENRYRLGRERKDGGKNGGRKKI